MIKAYNDQAATEPKPHGALSVYVPVDVAMPGGSNQASVLCALHLLISFREK